MSWKEMFVDAEEEEERLKEELHELKKECIVWKCRANFKKELAQESAREQRVHEGHAVDLGWVMESCAEFLELVAKVVEPLEPKGSDAERLKTSIMLEKLKKGLTKWPEYFETKKNCWEKRLEVEEEVMEKDAVEKELKEQEKQVDELEKELETIEEKIKKDIVPMQQSDPEQHPCPYCDRIYASAKWLKRHVREDHPGQPTTGIDEDRVSFECPHGCGKTYQTRGWLMRHLRDKHGERPQSDEAADSNPIYCPHCDKKYASVGWLRRHVQKDHEGETDPDIGACGMRVPCPFCDRKYASFVSLKKRLKDKHENEAITGSDEDSVRLSCPHCKEV
ncbi:unnamed protein product [Trypanosoma congolense IL3000]|uniref:WGS project CAEQ00000000 data, annotated contig 344 n=1 Tax=Trypanosoma congolense (strain IL3000) TaxID=1068625 RepID=F9WF36_TRYCI|nr:unnamed protein product [Trypanosoma congolense IL3000]